MLLLCLENSHKIVQNYSYYKKFELFVKWIVFFKVKLGLDYNLKKLMYALIWSKDCAF